MKISTQTGDAPPELEKTRAGAAGRRILTPHSPILKDVRVELDAKLGLASLSVQELLALNVGTVVKLDARLNDLVELRLNNSAVARGEIVAIDDNFGIRIVEIGEIK
ncbi:MAG TPA: FliM/FliN family flagellar motor switch protein [Caulobacteraceae bacterium]|jgi:flagellar motor switch protein FliN/FliY|nr:FliM/FliN family flagellar motor switch protein [Caulobacteraceae bacterium]